MTSLRPDGRLLLMFVAATASGCAGRVNDDVWRPFASWAFASALGTAISQSNWLFAVIESFHLTGLAILGGAVILIDFRLLGLGVSDEPIQKLSRSAEPWMFVGLLISVVSGSLLFFSEATKFYSEGFWDSAEAPFILKMLFLILAVVFTFTIRRAILRAPASGTGVTTTRNRFVGVVSLLLWLAVGVGGRSIGFY